MEPRGIGARVRGAAWARARARLRSSRDQSGAMLLVDVIMAVTILAVILVPVAYLVIGSQRTVTSYSQDSAAQLVATQTLNSAVQEAIGTLTWPPTASGSASPLGYVNGGTTPGQGCTTTNTCPWPTANTSGTLPTAEPACSSNPSGQNFPICEYVGSVTYKVTLAGGWCASAAISTNVYGWTQPTASSNQPLVYVLAVRVQWNPRNASVNTSLSTTNHLVQYATIPNQQEWTLPTLTTSSLNTLITEACPTTLETSS